MPSSTPNYGWSYPISSDDLNAGATTIGSFATAADATMATKAPLASPALTGIPTAPTGTIGTHTTQIANHSFVIDTVGANQIEQSSYLVTTSAAGTFTFPWDSASAVLVAGSKWPWNGLISFICTDMTPTSPSTYLAFETHTGASIISQTVRVNYIRWSG